MSGIKALERLRMLGSNVCWRIGGWPKHPEDMANEIADAIQAEIAERYMKLPVDADGVPIHVGDVLESTNAFKKWCVVVGIGDTTKHDHIIYVKFEAAGNISQTWASKFIHRKPDAEYGERKAMKR